MQKNMLANPKLQRLWFSERKLIAGKPKITWIHFLFR